MPNVLFIWIYDFVSYRTDHTHTHTWNPCCPAVTQSKLLCKPKMGHDLFVGKRWFMLLWDTQMTVFSCSTFIINIYCWWQPFLHKFNCKKKNKQTQKTKYQQHMFVIQERHLICWVAATISLTRISTTNVCLEQHWDKN